MVLSWTVFKPSLFSFPFLPTAMHIILNVFQIVFNNWCVQHQDNTRFLQCLTKLQCYYSLTNALQSVSQVKFIIVRHFLEVHNIGCHAFYYHTTCMYVVHIAT